MATNRAQRAEPTPDADDPHLAAARAATAGFLASLDRPARLVVFCHFDADGLAAGAVLGRALPRLGFADVRVVHAGRTESAWSPEARERLAALRPAALVVADLGVRHGEILPGVPTLLVDHHQPDGAPPGAVVASGYGWEPTPTSSWLAWELLAPLADVDDLAWIAAVGAVGDLGEKADWPVLATVRARHTAKWLKEAVALVNAARRASAFDVATPLALLMRTSSPRELVEAPEAAPLRAYRAEVNAELAIARRKAPVFSADNRWALLTMRSRAQIHPLVAQQWRGRLPNHVVIAANAGYVPDVVAFSARTARGDLNLPTLLRAARPNDTTGRFGHGHDQASGGQLATADFAALLRALGFAEAAVAAAVAEPGAS